ncbi:hypothetical protein AB1328_15275, partial [Streptomyces virginiae]
VRGPAEVATEWVATSVTCEKATPTGGASSPGASPSPQSPTVSPAATAQDGGPDQAALVRTGR